MSELFLAVDILTGVLAFLVVAFVMLSFSNRKPKSLHKLKKVHGGTRYKLSGGKISSEDFSRLLDSLERQLRDQKVDYIFGLDEAGYIIGRILATRLSPDLDHLMPCKKVEYRTADLEKGVQFFWNSRELEDQSFSGYIGKRKPTHIAVLCDFDPKGKKTEPITNLIKGAFPGRHTYQRVFLAITREQQFKLNRRPRRGESRSDEALWAVRITGSKLKLPW